MQYRQPWFLSFRGRDSGVGGGVGGEKFVFAIVVMDLWPVPSFRHRGVLFCENDCYCQLNGCGLHIHNIKSKSCV